MSDQAPQADTRQAATVDLSNADLYTLRRVIECVEKMDERPRPMCRDCADENGTCPNSGLECDMGMLITLAKSIYNRLATPAVHTCTPADERALFEAALKETWQMVDPHSKAQPGSYAKGEQNGMIAALKTIKENFARAAQGAGTAPVAVSQAVDVCTPCQGAGLVQHYLGGKTVCLDCATHPAPVAAPEALAGNETHLHMWWRTDQAEWRECMPDAPGAVEFVGVVPFSYVGGKPEASADNTEARKDARVASAVAFASANQHPAPEAPATEQQGDLVGNLKLALQRVKSSSLLIEARQFADVGLALIDVQGKATPAATTASASIDTAEFRRLSFAYAEALFKGTVPQTSAAWAALVEYIDSRAADGQQGASRAALGKDTIRSVFMKHGFTIKEGQTDLKDYVYAAAYELVALARSLLAQERPDA